jgi:hypothetical protein
MSSEYVEALHRASFAGRSEGIQRTVLIFSEKNYVSQSMDEKSKRVLFG